MGKDQLVSTAEDDENSASGQAGKCGEDSREMLQGGQP
jgi:hypothetical protein